MLLQAPLPALGRASQRPRARRTAHVACAAADSGLSVESVKLKLAELSQAVPPLLTAATLPVIALSLLCKAATGSGLPGALGAVEGVSFLILPFGLPNLLPRLGEIAGSPSDALAILSRDQRGAISRSALTRPAHALLAAGESASERVARITSVTDPQSALGLQLADLARAREKSASLTPEQRAAAAARNRELALAAINGVGKGISKSDLEKADSVGRDALLSQPVAVTMAAGMTVENFSGDVTKMTDEQLGAVNLSTPDANAASPHAH